jgi:hypothetical protein
MAKIHDGLTARQRKYVQVHRGDDVAAAKEAGFKSPHSSVTHLRRNPLVMAALADRERDACNQSVLSRADVDNFLHAVMTGQAIWDGKKTQIPSIPQRLSAAEAAIKLNARAWSIEDSDSVHVSLDFGFVDQISDVMNSDGPMQERKDRLWDLCAQMGCLRRNNG